MTKTKQPDDDAGKPGKRKRSDDDGKGSAKDTKKNKKDKKEKKK